MCVGLAFYLQCSVFEYAHWLATGHWHCDHSSGSSKLVTVMSCNCIVRRRLGKTGDHRNWIRWQFLICSRTSTVRYRPRRAFARNWALPRLSKCHLKSEQLCFMPLLCCCQSILWWVLSLTWTLTLVASWLGWLLSIRSVFIVHFSVDKNSLWYHTETPRIYCCQEAVGRRLSADIVINLV